MTNSGKSEIKGKEYNWKLLEQVPEVDSLVIASAIILVRVNQMLCHMAEFQSSLIQKPQIENHVNSNHEESIQEVTDSELAAIKNDTDPDVRDSSQNNYVLEAPLSNNCGAFNNKNLEQNDTNLEESIIENHVNSDHENVVTNHADYLNEDLAQNNIESESSLVENHVDSNHQDAQQDDIGLKSVPVEKCVDSDNEFSLPNETCLESLTIKNYIDSNNKDALLSDANLESSAIEKCVDSNNGDLMENVIDPGSSLVENDVCSNHKDTVQNKTSPEFGSAENHADVNDTNLVQNDTNLESPSIRNCDSDHKDLVQKDISPESISVTKHIEIDNKDLTQNSNLASPLITDHSDSDDKDSAENGDKPKSPSVETRVDSNGPDLAHDDTSHQSLLGGKHVGSSHEDTLEDTSSLKMTNNVSKENCTSDESKKFVCKECLASFDTQEEENSHKEKTHPDSNNCTYKKQRCAYCNKAIGISNLQDHLIKCKRKGGKKLIKCPFKDCYSRFSHFKSQQRHLQRSHVKPIPCSYERCEKFLKPSPLFRHMMNDHGHKSLDSFDVDPPNVEEQLETPIITKNAQSPREISESHIKKIKKKGHAAGSKRVPTIVCGVEGCTELFFKPNARFNHLVKRHPTPLSCPYKDCTLQLRPHLLEKHLVYEHGEVNPLYSKKMSQASSHLAKICYEKAIRDEKIFKNFKCPDRTCSATFLDDSSRCEHVKKCHRKIPCPFEECDFALPSQELENHMKTQHVKLSSSNDSEIDEFSLTRRKRFSCLVFGCESIFSCGSSRSNHLVKQHNSVVKCPFPDCKTSVPSEVLSAHMKVKHGDVKDETLEAQLLQAEEAKSSTRRSLNDTKEPSTKVEAACQAVKQEKPAEKESLSVPHPIAVESVAHDVSTKAEKKSSAELDKMSKARLEKIFDIKELFESMKIDGTNAPYVDKGFKCYVRGCPHVYSTVKSRKDHVYKYHAVPFPCPYNDCKVVLTPAKLQNHLKYLHNPLKLNYESKAACTREQKKTAQLEYESQVEETQKESEVIFDCMFKECNAKFSSWHSRASHYHRYHPNPVQCHFSGCDVLMRPVSLERHIKRDHRHSRLNKEKHPGGAVTPNSSQKTVKCKKEPEEVLPAKRIKIDEYEDQYVDTDKKYKCSFRDCPATFDTTKLRLDHERVHSTLILCPHPECKLVKRGNLELNDHIRYDHVDFKTTCFKCKKSYKWIKIKEHIENCHATFAN